ncbi:MAG TPA: TIGR02266 family protein [Thermoanaerobaculia bacterium]
MTEYATSRDSRRVPLETRVQLRFERFSGFISEYSSNVSPGGLFVKTQAPSPVGTLLDFEFQLGDGYPLIKGTGEVVWTRSDDQGTAKPAGMGIRFLRLSKGSRELIYKMVDEYIHEGGIPFDVEQGPEMETSPAAAAVESESSEPDDADEAGEVEVDPALASLSLPDLAARTFGAPVEPVIAPAPPPLAAPPPPLPAPPAPLAAYAAAEPPPERRSARRIAALAAALALVALGVAAFAFQEPLMRRFGLLGDGAAAPERGPAASPTTATETPAPPTAGPSAPAAAASDDAIPEPFPALAGDDTAAASAAAPAAAPPALAAPAAAPPTPAAPAPATAARLTAIRSIDWRQVDGETEVTIRGDAPIAAGGYARDRLDGPAPREVIRIRGVERPFGRALLAVGSPHLKQVRIGHHVLPGQDELHLVLDLADRGVVVRAVREVDGALVVRLGRG